MSLKKSEPFPLYDSVCQIVHEERKDIPIVWLIIQTGNAPLIGFFMPEADGGEKKLRIYAEAYLRDRMAYGRAVPYGKLGKLAMIRTAVDGWLWLHDVISATELTGELTKENVFLVVKLGIKKQNQHYYLVEPAFPNRTISALGGFCLYRDMVTNSILDDGGCTRIDITGSIGNVIGFMSVGYASTVGFEYLVKFERVNDGNESFLEYVFSTLIPARFQILNGLLELANINVGHLHYNVAVDKTTVAGLDEQLHKKASVFVSQDTPVIRLILSKSG